MSGRRAVFLDRDGVLIRSDIRSGVPHPPGCVDEMEILPGVCEAVNELADLGLLRIIVTNQPDVDRGTQSIANVEAINHALCSQIKIDDVYVCFHDNYDQCLCRKPRPGMLRQAAARYGIDLSRSFMVGDRWSDVVAGQSAGCCSFLINEPYSQRARCRPEYDVSNLAIAAEKISELITQPRSGKPDSRLKNLKTQIFADGADLVGMLELYRLPHIQGFTTNPTLMRKAGIHDYRTFGMQAAAAIPDRPISFEVFSDEFDEMERQAHEIATWGPQVYVKIPVTNTRGESACALVRRLTQAGIKLNVTALMTLSQVREVSEALGGQTPCFISVFAGRIADTGRDPVPLMAEAVAVMRPFANQKLIWASPRELLNIFHAEAIGCHSITVTYDLLKKLAIVDKDLGEYSLETVKMFRDDAVAAGFTL